MMLGELSFSQVRDGVLTVTLSGHWRLQKQLPPIDEVQRQLESGTRPARVVFDTNDLFIK